MSPNIPSDNRALTNLDMSNNNFYSTEAGKALGKMLAVNTVLKQLDLSGCNIHSGVGTKAVAVGIRDNGALSTFTFSGDYGSGPFTMETTMTEADFSGKELGVSGGMMVAAFLPKCQ
jgi:hypothetical protein